MVIYAFTAAIDCSGKTSKVSKSSRGQSSTKESYINLQNESENYFLPSITLVPVFSCSCTGWWWVFFCFLLPTGSPRESHTLFLLLGAHVPTKQQAVSLRLFSSCWLVAAGPQSLFLSTLLLLPPPLLSLLLLRFHCSAVFQNGTFG